ncbi:MAG: DUF3868 domain-containing protein [Tannerellaceae bacterium]|jgi:hypothetical protein|nr:DUF3868 domain-containing protein [Tannerellaceae bacterium]
MRRIIYLSLFFLATIPFLAQAQPDVGRITVKLNRAESNGRELTLDMDIHISNIHISPYESLTLTPMLRKGRESILLKPVIIHGGNKRKMYKRRIAFKGKNVADAGAYTVLKNDPELIQCALYEITIPYKSWMNNAELVLIGETWNYQDTPVSINEDVLEKSLKITTAKTKRISRYIRRR